MEVMDAYHNTMGVTTTDCCDYSKINWNGLTPISQAQMDAEWMGIYKTKHLLAMGVVAENEVTEGFFSGAVGGSPMYFYASSHDDQLNLIGSAAAGDDMDYAVWEDGVKSYIAHTASQLQQVVRDGRDVKLAVLQKFNDKQGLVIAATTEAEVDAITWD